MKQFYIFVHKEFLHVFRDRKTLLILFGLPIVQVILYGFALTTEVKNSRIVVVDHAEDPASQRLITRIDASKYFDIQRSVMTPQEIETAFKQGKVRLAIVFPVNFNYDLIHKNSAQLQVIADASDPNTATTLTNYVSAIVMDYQKELNQNNQLPYQIDTEVRMLYNPELSGAPNFVPGVMALVLMLVCVMMTSISIVREKELGTMEVLLVSPFKPIFVVIAKAVPYLILSFVNIISILLLSVFLLNLPIQGSIFLLLAESTLFIITSLSLGLLISVGADTQQTAMASSMMSMMLPTMLLSGFLFPIENMPVFMQVISNFVPSRWYYIIVKAIMLKGLGFQAIWKETMILVAMTAVLVFITVRKFKIRLG
ncbi:MAG TPA: ABC transporter permease [Bacteroidota bacterium]|nr:ABC transporter permease [Bacteroidota bacterium]